MADIKQSALELIGKTPLLQLNGYAKKNGIKDISITGGEPFLYWNKLKKFPTNKGITVFFLIPPGEQTRSFGKTPGPRCR